MDFSGHLDLEPSAAQVHPCLCPAKPGPVPATQGDKQSPEIRRWGMSDDCPSVTISPGNLWQAVRSQWHLGTSHGHPHLEVEKGPIWKWSHCFLVLLWWPALETPYPSLCLGHKGTEKSLCVASLAFLVELHYCVWAGWGCWWEGETIGDGKPISRQHLTISPPDHSAVHAQVQAPCARDGTRQQGWPVLDSIPARWRG